MNCPQCNHQAAEHAQRCEQCGSSLAPEQQAAPARGQASVAERRQFRRHLLDRSDPFELVGAQQRDFSIAAAYFVAGTDHQQLHAALFERIIDNAARGLAPDVSLKLLDIDDATTGSREPPRRYLILKTQTRRQTRLTTYVTCMSYGEYMYLSLESFLLGKLNLLAAVLTPLFYLALFVTLAYTAHWTLLLFGVAIGGWLMAGALVELLQGKSVGHVLRKRFSKPASSGSFDIDDSFMFLKSTNELVLRSVQEVFAERGIPTDMVSASLMKINNVTATARVGGTGNLLSAVLGSFLNLR